MKPVSLGLALAAAAAASAAFADDLFLSPPIEASLEAAAGHGAVLAQRDALKRARPGAAAVGDPDSFGRNVKWLGLLAGSVFLQPNCTPGDAGCVALQPAPATTVFEVPDIAVVSLPAGSSHSLLCHWQTPVVGVQFINTETTRSRYQLRADPVYRISSPVLRGLRDPNTGQPYNGTIEVPIVAVATEGYLAPGDHAFEQFTGTRTCIGGLVDRNNLVNRYGLSEREATQFFRGPIEVRMGIRGQAKGVDIANLYFGTRLTGD